MSDRMLALPLGAALALALAAPAGAVTLEWVAIGAPGNAPDVASNCNAASCGAVSHEYEIGRYEITNDQYAEFLNAVAADDPNGLYNPAMASDARGGIVRAGTPGIYTYSVKNGRGGDPVVFVSLWDAMRFANWLQNGQPIGAQGPETTETGSYRLTEPVTPSNPIVRARGAHFVVPNENEWYKAAYYDPATQSYFHYPTGSDAMPGSDAPPGGANSANYYDGTFAKTGSATFVDGTNYLTPVGAYSSSPSPFGTFDQGGNVAEWTERIRPGGFRRTRGGSWDNLVTNLGAPAKGLTEPDTEADFLGFRVAAVPEPAGAAAAAVLALGALAARRARGAARTPRGR